MLGIDRRRLKLDIAACGKHPAFSDYIRVNADLPMVNALASWVDAGMRSGGMVSKKNRGIHSFRFWTMGVHKQSLIVGIIRDSSDSLGRIYPLLIMGQAYMKDKNRFWHTVFDRFGQVFRDFEAMTAARYDRFNEFEKALSDVRFPEIDMDSFFEASSFSDCLVNWSASSPLDENLILPMPVFLENYEALAGNNSDYKIGSAGNEPPKAVFIGGLPEKPITAIYQRPLRTEDFCRLFDLLHDSPDNADSL
jgi:type VI secretion system ImpM family protein